jgi:UDP-N-acetylmuramate dehydrogenase
MKIENNVEMSKYTSFRAGGTAARLVTAETEEELSGLVRNLNEKNERFVFLGNGTNTLFACDRFEGTVIMLGEMFGEVSADREIGRLRCGAACLLSRAAREACRASLTGLEFAAGIPGSVGGAVYMNAGAYGGEMKDVIESVKLMDRRGHTYSADAGALRLGYRTSRIQASGEIVLSATLALARGEQADIEARMQELAAQRAAKQPLEYPSAGSFFKRPEGNFAGKLIQDAGLAGLTVGGAQVSPKHCGFVINTGKATWQDIIDLMNLVRNTVNYKFGVLLEPEVRIITE